MLLAEGSSFIVRSLALLGCAGVARTARGAVAQVRRGARTIRAWRWHARRRPSLPASIPSSVQTTSTGSATSASTAPTRRRHGAAVAAPARDRAGMNVVHTV